MNRNYFFVIFGITVACLFLIFTSMWPSRSQAPIEEEQAQPQKLPFASFIFGVGVVESEHGNILIGASINRIVDKVPVIAGMKVKKGDELIKFENSDLQADLVIQELAYQQALANVRKLKSLPRKEDVQSAEAAVKSAESDLAQALSLYRMVQGLSDPRALSQEEVNRRAYAYETAKAKLDQAQAELNKIQSGAWKPELEIAQLEAMQAQANIRRIKTNIQRTIVKSPIDGIVLLVKIHQGEVPALDTYLNPLMILGNTEEKYLKVSINQFDVPYFRSEASAVAFLQGDSRFDFPLEFVRVEPILVSKQNLTNDIMEKIDTRVLNVIYKIKNDALQIYPGQQMDVYIEANYSSGKQNDA